MRKQFSPGNFLTDSGLIAKVHRLSQLGKEWALIGAIRIENSLWTITKWHLNGEHWTGEPRFRLKDARAAVNE